MYVQVKRGFIIPSYLRTPQGQDKRGFIVPSYLRAAYEGTRSIQLPTQQTHITYIHFSLSTPCTVRVQTVVSEQCPSDTCILGGNTSSYFGYISM